MNRLRALRALARVELRQARRHVWRSSLVAALIALPVAGLVGGSVLARAITRPGADSIEPAVFVLGSLGFVEATLVIAATFAIGLRRRQREVGLLAANGAEPRDVVAAILGSAAVLALIGGALGAGLGTSVAAALLPHVERWLGRDCGEFAVPVAPLLGTLGLGLGAALLSAWLPARAATRLPVCAALAGRRPVAGSTRRWTRAGIGLVITGLVLVVAGAAAGATTGAIANVLGSALVVLGLAGCAPGLLDVLARHADNLPLAWRLAAREAGRLRHRNGPVVAAILAAMAVSVTTSSLCASMAAADAALAPHAPANTGADLLARTILLLALGIGISVLWAANALTAVEASDERRTLIAIGAPPRVSRVLAGARAACLGAIGCALAIPAGLLPALGLTAFDPGLDFVVPWGALAWVWLALPVLAYVAAWSTTPPLR